MKNLFHFGITKKRGIDESTAVNIGEENTKDTVNFSTSSTKRLVQTSIDLGQKGLGPSQCLHCGMVYSNGITTDDKIHENECKKRFKIGRRVDILRKVNLYKPSDIDDVVADCFEFAFVRPCEYSSEFVKKIMLIAQRESRDLMQSVKNVLSPLHRVAICIGTDDSLSLQSNLASKAGSCTLYAIACIKQVNSSSALAQLEVFWIHPSCVEVTLQTDIFRGVMEVLKMNAIYGHCLTDKDIHFGSTTVPV